MSLKINAQEVQSVVAGLTASLGDSEAYAAYEGIISALTDSSGEEAKALRKLQEAEKSMIKEMNDTLIQFANSVQYAADSFSQLDSSAARSLRK